MTSQQLKAILSVIPAVKSVFASGANYRSEITFSNDQKRIAYDTGIPQDPYAKDIESDNGKHVLIGDINAVGNVATTGIFLRQNGGTNEFDERVLLIDKGTKGDTSEYGYPLNAIIDWWNGSTFKKVVCVKSGGNCKHSPDDAVHGVNGSGDRYWEVVNQIERKKYEWQLDSWNNQNIVEYNSGTGTYTFKTMCKAFLRIQYNIRNNHNDNNTSATYHTFLPIVARNGDTLSISYTTVTFNGTAFQITPSMFQTYRSYVIVSGIVISTDSIYTYAMVQ